MDYRIHINVLYEKRHPHLKDKQWAEIATYLTNQRLTSKKKSFKPRENNRTMGIRYRQATHKRKKVVNKYMIRWSKSQ